MADEKLRFAAALVKARADLDDALFELEKLPAVSQSAVNFATHTLGNFLAVTGVTAELLQLELADHPEPQVHKWIDALLLATEHMTHTVSQLMNTAAGTEAQLRFEKLDLRKLARQSCSAYQRVADRKQIQINIATTCQCRHSACLDRSGSARLGIGQSAFQRHQVFANRQTCLAEHFRR